MPVTLPGRKDRKQAEGDVPIVPALEEGISEAGGVGKHVRVFEVATGRKRLDLRGHSHHVMCVSFSRDSELLASGGPDEVWPVDRLVEQRPCWPMVS